MTLNRIARKLFNRYGAALRCPEYKRDESDTDLCRDVVASLEDLPPRECIWALMVLADYPPDDSPLENPLSIFSVLSGPRTYTAQPFRTLVKNAFREFMIQDPEEAYLFGDRAFTLLFLDRYDGERGTLSPINLSPGEESSLVFQVMPLACNLGWSTRFMDRIRENYARHDPDGALERGSQSYRRVMGSQRLGSREDYLRNKDRGEKGLPAFLKRAEAEGKEISAGWYVDDGWSDCRREIDYWFWWSIVNRGTYDPYLTEKVKAVKTS